MKTQKPFQELELYDSFLFAAVMEDEEICRQVLERILGFSIRKVHVHTEHTLVINPEYHGICPKAT